MKSLIEGFASVRLTSSGPPHLKRRAMRALSLVGTLLAVLASISVSVAPAAAAPVKPKAAASGSSYTPMTPSRILDTRMSGNTMGPNGHLSIDVTGGTTGVPDNATAMVFNATVTNTGSNGYLTLYPFGGSVITSNLNWGTGQTVANLTVIQLGNDSGHGAITIFNGSSGNTDVVLDREGYFAPPGSSTAGQYVALSPARIADTRSTASVLNPYSGHTLGPGGTLTVQVTGSSGVPPSGVSGVIFNLTETNATAGSYLTVCPGASCNPTINPYSNLNFAANETRPNRVFDLPPSGQVTVYNNSGNVDVIMDVNGYFTDSTAASGAGGLYTPISPARILDTRASGQTLGPMGTLDLQIAGVGSVPANASAALLNVVNDHATTGSYFTFYPKGTSRPVISDNNFGPNLLNPNLAAATLGANGSTTIFNANGSADAIVDVFGYFSAPPPPTATVTVTSDKPSVTADGTSTANITATAKDAGGTPVLGETITFSTNGSPAAACGTVNPTSGITGSNGQATTTYTASMTVGTCTITATASGGANGSVTINQTALPLTLSPTSQTKTADGSTANTPITATAKNPNNTANDNKVVYAKVTSGPDAGATDNCTTAGVNGTCDLFTGPTALKSPTAGTDSITALLDTDLDVDTVPDSDGDGAAEPTATATITWVPGPVRSLLLEPGGEDSCFFGGASNPNGACQTYTNYPPGGSGSTNGRRSAVTNHIGNSELFTVGAYDLTGNPVPGLGITFTDYFGSPTAMGGSCSPYNGSGSTITGCTVKTATGTTNANGKATYTVTSSVEGADTVYATVTSASGITSDGAEVDWGTSVLTVTPNYTNADVARATGANSTYTVVATTALGAANTNCASADIHEGKSGSYSAWGVGPDTDLSDGSAGSNAYFTGVGLGETAYSDSGCTTAITDFSTKPGEIFFKPDTGTGSFTFSITSLTNADSASPVVNTQLNSDFPQNWCDASIHYCGDVVPGATTVWT